MLEREALLATLREIEPGAMVFVAGEAGIGKDLAGQGVLR